MHREDFLDRFQLNDHFISNDEIDLIVTIERHSFVKDRHSDLPLKWQPFQMQLVTHTFLVNRLKQARPKVAVNLYSRFDDWPGPRITLVTSTNLPSRGCCHVHWRVLTQNKVAQTTKSSEVDLGFNSGKHANVQSSVLVLGEDEKSKLCVSVSLW